MTRSQGRILFALAAAAFLASHAAALDMVVLRRINPRTRKKVQHKGTIVQDDLQTVKLRLPPPGGELTFAQKDVEKVVYDESRVTPYKTGLAYFNAGQYEQALDSFQGALEQKHRPLLKQYILYYLGLTHERRKEFAEAVKAFEKLKALGTKTRFLVEAYYSLVTLSLEGGDISAAKGYLQELKRLIRGGLAGSIGPAQIALLEGLIEEKLKRYQRAIEFYKKAAAQGDGEIASQAQLGIARCNIGRKRPADAVKGIDRFVKRPRTSKVYAEAFLLMGDALKAQARTPDDWEKALMAYVRVPLRYPGDEKTEPRALYEAAGCYRRIGGEKGIKRSAQLLKMLRRKYPNSPLLREAR